MKNIEISKIIDPISTSDGAGVKLSDKLFGKNNLMLLILVK